MLPGDLSRIPINTSAFDRIENMTESDWEEYNEARRSDSEEYFGPFLVRQGTTTAHEGGTVDNPIALSEGSESVRSPVGASNQEAMTSPERSPAGASNQESMASPEYDNVPENGDSPDSPEEQTTAQDTNTGEPPSDAVVFWVCCRCGEQYQVDNRPDPECLTKTCIRRARCRHCQLKTHSWADCEQYACWTCCTCGTWNRNHLLYCRNQRCKHQKCAVAGRSLGWDAFCLGRWRLLPNEIAEGMLREF